MTLSIITINFNNRAGLEKTIESVMAQCFTNLEWIIIDGGSTDGSKELIQSTYEEQESKNTLYKKKGMGRVFNPISYWCSEPDKGAYNAMNKGLMKAKGEFVCFMNSGDCFYENNTLEKVFAEEQNADVIYGDAYFVLDNKKERKTYPNSVSFRWLYNDTINHQAAFCKTEKLKKFMFDESYKIMADRKVWLQMYMNGCTFKHLPLTVALYDHSGMSATDGNRWLAELKRLHEEMIPNSIQKNSITCKLYKVFLEIQARIRRFL